MTNILLPFPITEIENGVLLYYFIVDPSLENNIKEKIGKRVGKIKYQFISYKEKDYCLFNDIFAVPMELFERLDLKTQKFLYFMKYSMDSLYSEVILVFEIDEEFIINYKAFKAFLEYKKTLEQEKNVNQESSYKSIEENVEKIKEKTEILLN
jgi:hypothetical protein